VQERSLSAGRLLRIGEGKSVGKRSGKGSKILDLRTVIVASSGGTERPEKKKIVGGIGGKKEEASPGEEETSCKSSMTEEGLIGGAKVRKEHGPEPGGEKGRGGRLS